MNGIPVETAADAFRRFFPEDWPDHLRAWMAAKGLATDPPSQPTTAPRIVRREAT